MPWLTCAVEPYFGFHSPRLLPEHSMKWIRDTEGKVFNSSMVRINGRSTRP